MNIQEKIKEIKSHKNFFSDRATASILKAIAIGVDFNDEKKMFEIVKKAYTTGKHRSDSYIKGNFKHTIKFIKKEFKDVTHKQYLEI